MENDTGTSPKPEDAAAAWAEFEAEDKAAAGAPAPATNDDNGTTSTPATGSDDALVPSLPERTEDVPADDIWKDAPEHLRTAFNAERERAERLEHRERSNAGRITALQRNIETLKAQAADTASSAPKITELLEPLRSEYSEVSEPIERALSSVEERMSQHEEGRRKAAKAELEHSERELAELVNTEAAAVEAAHPGWTQFIGERQEQFRAWADDQPRAMREMILRNGESVVNGTETAGIVASFKAFVDAEASPTSGSPPPSPSTPDRRQRQLAGSTSTPTRGNGKPVVSGVPETASAADHWRDMEARQIAV